MKTRLPLLILVWLPAVLAGVASGASPLFKAIREGTPAAVRPLLKGSPDFAARDEFGDTPLMAAAQTAPVEVLSLLIKAGADVNATNATGATPLMRAATFEEKARLLLAQGARVNVVSTLGNTPLILAARKVGNARTVKLLLDAGAHPNAANVFGATPLMAAVAAEDMDSVRLLLNAGADVSAKPGMDVDGVIWGGGRTPLMWAAFNGNVPMIQLLLSKGAKVDDLVVLGSPLVQAAWAGQVGAAQALLDAGAPVNQRDLVANYSPLHWAASAEVASPALTELLIRRGGDVNAEGGQPVDNFLGATETPLSLARKRGDTPIVNALLKAGAREKERSSGRTKKDAQPSSLKGGRTIPEAIQRALPLLSKTSEESFAAYVRHASKQQCVSCHQQQLPLVALSLAHSRQFSTDRQVTRHQLELLKQSVGEWSVTSRDARFTGAEVAMETTFHPEPTIMEGYTAMAFRLENEPSSKRTDALVHQLSTMQLSDGHWRWNLPRPPIQASDITATAMAVEAIQGFMIPGRRAELESQVKRARAWLSKARAETNEERAHQILGLARAGEKPLSLCKLADALIQRQRADGGWGQLAGLESDAYATGQALYALLEGAQLASTHDAIRRGLDYLCRTQKPDGSWYVRSRSHPFQPPMESGFPHGKDSWISCTASSWAVIALCRSLDPSKPAPSLPDLATAVVQAAPSNSVTPAVGAVDFVRDIKPLLERSCVACHSGPRPKGGFLVTERAAVLRGGARGEPAVLPGNPGASPLMRLVQDQVEDLEMPPTAKRDKFPGLTPDDLAKLAAWISQGAEWPQGVVVNPPGR